MCVCVGQLSLMGLKALRAPPSIDEPHKKKNKKTYLYYKITQLVFAMEKLYMTCDAVVLIQSKNILGEMRFVNLQTVTWIYMRGGPANKVKRRAIHYSLFYIPHRRERETIYYLFCACALVKLFSIFLNLRSKKKI